MLENVGNAIIRSLIVPICTKLGHSHPIILRHVRHQAVAMVRAVA